MPLINVAVQHFIVEDAVIAFADAGLDQSVFCASVIQLQGQILGDDPANHTFEWEQTFGTPVTLVNPNTLFPSFVNPQTSDIEFTLYVDRNTPFETSDTVFISRVPTSTFKGSGSIASPHAVSSNVSGGSFHKITGSGSETLRFTDLDLRVSSYSYNYPPDSTWQPIYSAEDLRRMKDNLKGSYWLMKDIDMDDLLYPWDPIGTAARPFIGDLHGNGFSIQNLSITSTPVLVDGGDEFYDSVTMNNDFEGTNGQQTYTGTFGDTWTFDNQAQISSNQAFSGSTSVLFDGSGDRMYTSNAPGLFGSGDFTIEFYAYPLTDDSNQFITNVWSGVNNRSWSFDMGVNNNLTFLVARSSSGAATLNAGTNTINENEWTHVVAMRKGTGLYLFRNGVLADQTTIGAAETIYENGVVPTTDLYIGRRPGSLTHYNGHIDLYRLTAAARYPTTGFAPPTEFPDTIYKPAGLFSYIGNDAVIEEIGLTNANINGVSSSFYKGILAGSAQGYGTDDGGTVTVRNVYVEGTVDSGGDRAGGLIGHTGTNVGTLFENTLADVTVTGGGTNTGGWAGNFQTECSYNDNYWNVEKTTLGVGTAGDTALTGELDARTTLQLNQQVYYENWNFIDTWEMPFAEPFTDYADPDGWSTPLIQEWDSRDVDLTNITSTYTTVRMSGFAWSPDGTKLTIANTSDDNIKTFTCSTPWDPSTAGAPITSRGVTNPWGGVFYNADGTKLASITVVGDKISQYNATDYVMDNNTEVTALTKADAGLAGTQDGPFTVNDDMTQVYWFGDSNEFNRVSLNSSGDFDNFTLEQQATPITQNFNLGSQLTKISLDETSFYICVSAADNIRLYRMSTPQDTSTTALVGSFDLSTVTNQGWRAEKCWMDPNDTRFLWVASESGTNGIQFAVLDTGVDTANRPAQLQNNIFDRVANAGTTLETTGRQGVIWNTPTTTIGGENEFRGREYIGAVVQDQNPSTGGWENARFIPPEQTEALITQGRRHRVFAVIDMTPKSRATKELRRVPREASFLVQKTVMPRGTTQGNASFIGGSTKFTAPLGSADLGVQSLSITIVNPRKTTFLALDTVGIHGMSDHLPFTAFTVVRYEPTVFTQTDTVAVGYISEHSVWVSASSFTRVYGGSIG